MTYIFDFDGTLVDSVPYYGRIMMNLLDDNRVAYPDNFVEIVTPLGYGGTAQYVISLGLKMPAEEFIDTVVSRLTYDYENIIPLKNNVKEKLLELKAAGHSLNVLTASPHVVVDPCLKRTGIYELLDNVWTCEDFGHMKSETVIYEIAAEKLGKKVEECTFLDDNITSLATAKKAGMIAIGVYEKVAENTIDEMKAVGDRYIYDFCEL